MESIQKANERLSTQRHIKIEEPGRLAFWVTNSTITAEHSHKLHPNAAKAQHKSHKHQSNYQQCTSD